MTLTAEATLTDFLRDPKAIVEQVVDAVERQGPASGGSVPGSRSPASGRARMSAAACVTAAAAW